MLKLNGLGKVQSEAKNEVMSGYTWGGNFDNPQPLGLSSSYGFELSGGFRSFDEQRSFSSPLITGGDLAMD
jgi:hypothetical protein